jgi:hypothetical protein
MFIGSVFFSLFVMNNYSEEIMVVKGFKRKTLYKQYKPGQIGEHELPGSWD